MMWKTLVFAFLLAGVFADEYQLSSTHKEEIKKKLSDLCKKADAEDKTDEANTAVLSFVDCVKTLVNVNDLKQEIEDAKPNGALDEVFKKYCAKTPQLKTCIHTLLDGVTPCIETSMREQLNFAKNGTDQLIDFVCYKDGDRIALFIAEKGPECFTDKMNAIRNCTTTVKDSMGTVEDAKNLSVEQRCGKFDELSTCIVNSLEQCETPTPGNMAESLFRYVRKASPCNTALPKN